MNLRQLFPGLLTQTRAHTKMDTLEAGVLLLLCLFFLILFSSFKMYKKKGQLPPGPTPWLFLGNLLQKDVMPLDKFYPKLVQKYGPIFTIWMGPKPAVVLCGYEVVKDALVDHSEVFGGRSPLPISKRVTKGQGLAIQKDAKWRDLRRFTLSTLRDFGMGKKSMSERVQEEALCLVKHITAAIQGKTFDLQKCIRNAASNVLCSVVIGSRFDYQNETVAGHLCIAEQLASLFQSYTGMLYSSFSQMMDYLPGPHQKVFADCKKLQAYIREEVKSHSQTLDPENPRDYIDCFLIKLEKEKTSCELIYNQEDIVMSVFGLFVAGSSTTSNALNFGIFLMARLPHIQAKVQEEINEVIGISRPPKMEDRMRMPFTNAVVHEVQRHMRLNPENFSRCTTCCTEFRGFTIPQDTVIIPHLTSVHFDPLMWETPQEFNPAHFLDEKGQFKKKDAFMPFSAGKRACPGEALAHMELFLFFTTLLQNFHFQLVGEATDIDLFSSFNSYRNQNLKLPIQATKRLL
ncbi:cytochrome P450 2C20-like isoform X3 [Sceloporus undulatus]|uniref:cytochrome P450 2C20-like isoform X3 n=1 Tax=Sceloporus undulatus TaxID=8520 RepID=UPI001C4B1F15|nr:cytochrome P450 2C20-like isoform X3 [Sceloporus undulatus]